MFLEIIDKKHPVGCPKYFSSIKQRDDFLIDKKDHLLKISENEVHDMMYYWKNNI